MSLSPLHYVNLMSIRPYGPHRPLSLHDGASLGHYLYMKGGFCKLCYLLLRIFNSNLILEQSEQMLVCFTDVKKEYRTPVNVWYHWHTLVNCLNLGSLHIIDVTVWTESNSTIDIGNGTISMNSTQSHCVKFAATRFHYMPKHNSSVMSVSNTVSNIQTIVNIYLNYKFHLYCWKINLKIADKWLQRFEEMLLCQLGTLVCLYYLQCIGAS